MLIVKQMDRDPVNNLISIETLKEHIRQDDDYEDEMMEAYLLAAIDYAEKYTNRYFTETNILSFTSNYSEKIYIGYDVNDILSVKAKSSENKIIDINDYTLNIVTNELILPQKYAGHSDIQILFSTGYKKDCVPRAIIQGILMLFATIYEVREDVSYGVAANKVPFRSTMMLDMYKNHISY